MEETISYMPIGGIGDVTKNMHLYIYKDEILIVDCGLGFADETMLGVPTFPTFGIYREKELSEWL